ncbi:hypothetical protein GA607_06605 [Bifidobacterium adolescentis]|nr:hypothetical protein GA606_09295 [Bifidobacterium adolescentis]KAB5916991.1 hypothetical protein GA608_07840 [Bifidobacterium adolescentis]KAB5921942.1 hypothetical protein GA607_06605 [Bifidobacterium adolescentis]KAB5925000.1 hypothetical protein GA605_06220 [Bifidobacterium adolescentis]KAB5927083.1 hypothetical protein GA611_06585 [Bifidobacterium adolescentis]
MASGHHGTTETTDGFSNRDRKLLTLFGMTEEQVLEDEMIAESETIPDGLVGPVYYGRHHGGISFDEYEGPEDRSHI